MTTLDGLNVAIILVLLCIAASVIVLVLIIADDFRRPVERDEPTGATEFETSGYNPRRHVSTEDQ